MANSDSGNYKTVHGASKLSLLIAFGAGAVVAWFMLWVNAQGTNDPDIQDWVAHPVSHNHKMQFKPVVADTFHIANSASPAKPATP